MKLSNIKFEYNSGKKNNQVIFDNYNATFDNGFYVITGASGCGKSTLLHIAGGLMLPNSGDVMVDGVAINALTAREKAKFINDNISFVFQNFYLDKSLSVHDNVVLPMMIRKEKYKNLLKKAEECLTSVGLPNIGNKMITELSGGECQRVCIARALITDAKYILADEPTGNLDEKNSIIVVDLLHKCVDTGCTVVMVTHDKSLIRNTDTVLDLKKRDC